MKPLDQRLTRLRAHPHLAAFYETIPYHTRQVIEELLESGATYPLMERAGNCMHAVFQESLILQILSTGDPRALEAVTAAALDELEYLLARVGLEEEE